MTPRMKVPLYRDYFHYERGMEHSLFVLLIFPRLKFKGALNIEAKKLKRKQRILHSTLLVETSL